MPYESNNSGVLGTVTVGQVTASAGTAFAAFVQPCRGVAGSPPLLYKMDGTKTNWKKANLRLTSLIYTATNTAHSVVVMQPLNWCLTTADTAANNAVVNVDKDPGVYTTNFRYDLPPEASGLVAGVGDNAIAAGDYVAVQLRDGNWHFTTVSSVSSLAITLTTATPNVTGGGIETGSVMFFFGVAADVNPRTGLAHLALTSVASTRQNLLCSYEHGGIPSLDAGDPMVIYSANATGAGALSVATGIYTRY